MTHFNAFVLAVKDSKRNTLREYGGKVYLPFHSEYSQYMKNLNNTRVKVEITIDGTDVLNGTRLVIPANSSIDLERFVASNRKFLFVPAGDSRVQDSSNNDNGEIIVKFYKEYVYQPINTYYDNLYCSGPAPFFVSSTTTNGIYRSTNCSNVEATGATVEGSKSNQTFVDTGFFPTECEPTVLRLQLYGSEKPVTAKDTRREYCTFCGNKVRFNDNYCSKCGGKLNG